MKKLACLFITLALLFTFVSCNKVATKDEWEKAFDFTRYNNLKMEVESYGTNEFFTVIIHDDEAKLETRNGDVLYYLYKDLSDSIGTKTSYYYSEKSGWTVGRNFGTSVIYDLMSFIDIKSIANKYDLTEYNKEEKQYRLITKEATYYIDLKDGYLSKIRMVINGDVALKITYSEFNKQNFTIPAEVMERFPK